MRCTILWAIVITLTWIGSGSALKILGLFPMSSHSHYMMGYTLMKELATRGHEVTFISAFPPKESTKNLRNILLEGFAEHMSKFRIQLFDLEQLPIYKILSFGHFMGNAITNFTYSSQNVQNLLKSREKFDVIILEDFFAPSLMGLSYHYKAPLILLSAMGTTNWNNELFGNPAPHSYVPNMFSSYSSHMNFFQRLHNLFINTLESVYRHLVYYPKENEILHKYIPDAPPLDDILYNASLILLNSHSAYKDPVSVLPNMIEIGGYHISKPKPLPKDLKDFLDAAKEGVVYFSMGSNLKSADIPIEKRNEILKALSKIKQNVLWKFEDDNIPDLPKNVKVQKWFPQQDVLAHPNVKAFISHGGLLSTIETVYHGVPILGIPIFGDQKTNMAIAVEKGYGISLPYPKLSEGTLHNALSEILNNPKYYQNAKMRSRILHDRPMTPMDTAVYWIEYVARNGRCDHFRSAALDLTWYQKSMLDIALFLTTVTIALFLFFYYVIKKILGPNKHNVHTKEKKA